MTEKEGAFRARGVVFTALRQRIRGDRKGEVRGEFCKVGRRQRRRRSRWKPGIMLEKKRRSH